MARKRNTLGIVLLVLDIAAWAVFGYFLVKTITSATSLTNCFSTECAGKAEDTGHYVPWVVASAFAATILLAGAILAFRLRRGSGGPTTWDQVAQMGAPGMGSTPSGWPQAGPVAAPYGGPTVLPTAFTLPGAAPTWAPPAAGTAQATIVATRAVNSTPTGMEMQVDMDVMIPGQAPRRVSKHMAVPPGGLARLYPGAVLPVSVNPSNPEDVTLNLGS